MIRAYFEYESSKIMSIDNDVGIVCLIFWHCLDHYKQLKSRRGI